MLADALAASDFPVDLRSCSADAMLLHYNGKLKPWQASKWALSSEARVSVPSGRGGAFCPSRLAASGLLSA